MIIEAQSIQIQELREKLARAEEFIAIANSALSLAGLGEDFRHAFDEHAAEKHGAKTQIVRWQREYELQRYQAEKWRRLYRKNQKENAKPRSAAG